MSDAEKLITAPLVAEASRGATWSEPDRIEDPWQWAAELESRVARLEFLVNRIGETLNRYFGLNESEEDNTPAGRR